MFRRFYMLTFWFTLAQLPATDAHADPARSLNNATPAELKRARDAIASDQSPTATVTTSLAPSGDADAKFQTAWRQVLLDEVFSALFEDTPRSTDVSEFLFGDTKGRGYIRGRRPADTVRKYDWRRMTNPLRLATPLKFFSNSTFLGDKDFAAYPVSIIGTNAKLREQHREKIKVGQAFHTHYAEEFWQQISENPDDALGSGYRALQRAIRSVRQTERQPVSKSIGRARAEADAEIDFFNRYQIPSRDAPDDLKRVFEGMVYSYDIFHEERATKAVEVELPPARGILVPELSRIREALLAETQGRPPSRENLGHPFSTEYRANVRVELAHIFIQEIDVLLSALETEADTGKALASFNERMRQWTPATAISHCDDRTAFIGKETAEFTTFINDIKWWGLSRHPDYWQRRDAMANFQTSRAAAGLGLHKKIARDSASRWRNLREATAIGINVGKSVVQIGAAVGLVLGGVYQVVDIDFSSLAGAHKSQGTSGEGRLRDGKRTRGPDGFEPSFSGTDGGDNPFKNSPPLFNVTDASGRPYTRTLPFLDSSPGNSGSRPYALPAIGARHRIIPDIVIESVQALAVDNMESAIPTPLGYRLVSLEFGDGEDYNVRRDNAGFFRILNNDFKADGTTAKLRAGFVYDPQHSIKAEPSELNQLNTTNLAAEADALKRAGFTRLSAALSALLRQKSTVGVEDIVQLIKHNTVYSNVAPPPESFTIAYKPSDQVKFVKDPTSKTWLMRQTPYLVYEQFNVNRYRGDFVGECDHGAALLTTILSSQPIFSKHDPSAYSMMRVGELIPSATGLLADPGHSQVIFTKDLRPVLMGDATPAIINHLSVVFDGMGRTPGNPNEWTEPYRGFTDTEKWTWDVQLSDRDSPADRWRQATRMIVDKSPVHDDKNNLRWPEKNVDQIVQATAEHHHQHQASFTEAWRQTQMERFDTYARARTAAFQAIKLIPERHAQLPHIRMARAQNFLRTMLDGDFDEKAAKEIFGPDLRVGEKSNFTEVVQRFNAQIAGDLGQAVQRMQSDPAFRAEYESYFPHSMLDFLSTEGGRLNEELAIGFERQLKTYNALIARPVSIRDVCNRILGQL